MLHLLQDAPESASKAVPFSFEGTEVRVIERKGEPWWLLSDVCRVLEISNSRHVASRLDDDEKDAVAINDTIGRVQFQVIINESGLWSLVLTSRKPEAKRFKKWVTSEVLPAIRKTGGYIAAAPSETPEQIMARAVLVAKDTIERVKQQLSVAQSEIEVLTPKADVYDAVIDDRMLPSINKFCRTLDGVNLVRVKQTLAALGYLIRDPNMANCYRVRRCRGCFRAARICPRCRRVSVTRRST